MSAFEVENRRDGGTFDGDITENRRSRDSTFLGRRVYRGMKCDERRLGPEGETGFTRSGLTSAAKFRQHPVTPYT